MFQYVARIAAMSSRYFGSGGACSIVATISSGEDFLIEEEEGFSIRFSNEEIVENEIIFDDIDESQTSNDEIPDDVFN